MQSDINYIVSYLEYLKKWTLYKLIEYYSHVKTIISIGVIGIKRWAIGNEIYGSIGFSQHHRNCIGSLRNDKFLWRRSKSLNGLSEDKKLELIKKYCNLIYQMGFMLI